MSAEIRRTTVTPTEGGSVVHVHISDAPLEAPFASIDIQMTVSLPEYEPAILLAHAQRQAILTAQAALREHAQRLASEIGSADVPDLEPRVKGNS
jgi:hypothetical protein